MNYIWEKLMPHRGHEIECVTCNEILISAEDFEFENED